MPNLTKEARIIRDGRQAVERLLAGTDRKWTEHLGSGSAMSDLERQHRHREAAREIAPDFSRAVSEIDWPRRRAALVSLRAFIEAYCLDEGGILEYPPFAETDRIFGVMTAAAESATPYHLRLTRGAGKTAFMVVLAAFLLCKKLKRFIVMVGAKSGLAQQMVEDLGNLFTASPALAQDFPEFSLPLRMLDGAMQKAASQRFLGRPTLCRKNRNVLRFPTLASGCPLLPFSSGGAIVIATGFDGRTRGLRVGKRRPDFILLDDLQDDELAASSQRVEDARRKIYKTFMRLGSSIDRPSILMTSTPIAPDDLSETIANDFNWKTVTYPLLIKMPTDKALEMWRIYQSLKARDIDAGNFAAHSELDFYRENRAAMDDGAEPFWRECYNRDGTEISAIQHAMNLYLEDPESFASEYQMKPRRADMALDLPRAKVSSCVLPESHRLQIPPGFVFVAAATDINPSYALTTAIVAFKPDRTAFVVEHVRSPIAIDGKLPDTAFNQLLFSALVAHGRAIAALGVKINGWGIDASGRQFSAVTSFAKLAATMQGVRLPACAMMGRNKNKFNPFVRSRLRDALNSTVLCADEMERAGIAQGRAGLGARWMAWDADFYKEAVHRAFLAAAGSPGGCSLFADGDHTDFAIQVTNEKLVGKRPHGDGRDEYVWTTAEPHDYLDVMGMCYAIAGSQGVSGAVAAPHKNLAARRPRRRRVIIK